MRSLRRNQRVIYYSLYKGREDVYDDNGFLTGEKKPSYGKVKSVRATVSYPGGMIHTQSYGKVENYDLSVVVDEEIAFTEKTRFWVGSSTKNPHDYEVTKTYPTFDHTRVYLTKVRVDG